MGREGAVQAFFREFERRSDGEGAGALFAETFLAAGPEGVRAVPRSAFEPVLQRRRAWLAGLGCAGAELVSLREQWLDERYVLATTRWRMTFGAGRAIEVASSYLVDMGGEAPAIVVYLAHQDLTAVLRETGIALE